MPLPTLTSRCTGHRNIARDVFEFTLAKPPGFSFLAGQFVMFLVPLVEDPSDVQVRAFSIASAPVEEELLFVAKIKNGGRAGRWISEVLKVGDDVRFQGPLGNFTLASAGEPKPLFLATCSGVAPFRSQIVEALRRGDARPMDLVFCVREPEDVFWREFFEGLQRAFPNFRFHCTLSRAPAAWSGHAGRVQDAAARLIADLPERSLYVCGGPEMVKAVKAKAAEWGIAKERVHAEDYV